MSLRSDSIVFSGALCIALACLVFTGCKDKQAESTPVSTASVAPVTRDDLSSTLTVAGDFQPYQEVELHAKVSGYIRRINVDIGDRVKSGQVIATLEVPELSAQVAGSQAEVRHSQSEIASAQSGVALAEANYTAIHAAYTRLSEASKQRPGLVAEQELDDARARDLDAQAKINVAKIGARSHQRTIGSFASGQSARSGAQGLLRSDRTVYRRDYDALRRCRLAYPGWDDIEHAVDARCEGSAERPSASPYAGA